MEDHSLKQGLLAWHKHKVSKIFGDVDYFTPDIFLHLSILDHIVDLAHAHKLNSALDIKNQTLWCFAEEYGGQIIRILEQHSLTVQLGLPSASSLFISTPLCS